MQRKLSIDVNTAEDNNFLAALQLAKRAGSSVVSISLPFDELETAPGTFEPKTDFRKIANDFYPGVGMEVTLVLTPIDTGKNRLPADLQGKPFDHPDVLNRFSALLDDTFAKIPKLTLSCLSIGNEIDVYLGQDKTKWASYRSFFTAMAAYARKKRPGLKVGTKVTFAGMTRNTIEEARTIAQSADILLTTYYPLKPDFTVQSPSVVAKDFRTLGDIARTARKPLYLLECGYPSDKVCQSSEAMQAEFIRQVFAAWDREQEAIPLVALTWLTDVAPQSVEKMTQYYGAKLPAFAGYLASLGLRTGKGSGSDKAAYRAVLEEAKRRHFVK